MKAETSYVDEIRRLARTNDAFYRECTPGYYNSEGAEGNQQGFFSEGYGGGTQQFFNLLAQWRDEDLMSGLTVR